MNLTIQSTESGFGDSLYPPEYDDLVTVDELRRRRPLSDVAHRTIEESRREFSKILSGSDNRLVLIVGPCSIHDCAAAFEYAEYVRRWRRRFGETFHIVMRAYLEKPRTTLGWKGLISDPGLDGSCDMNRGLDIGRKLLCDLAAIGIPAATELVDPAVAPYIEDAVSWASIGARTVESQAHRQLVSGLAMPAGFKNGTHGDVRVAIDAMLAARHPHVFPVVGNCGRPRLTRTRGNPHTHVVLRGGRNGTGCMANWTAESIRSVEAMLAANGFPGRSMIDCSHANSGYQPSRQIEVARAVVSEVRPVCPSVFGLMLESNLEDGAQKLNGAPSGIRRGVSITDACISAAETEQLIEELQSRMTPTGGL